MRPELILSKSARKSTQLVIDPDNKAFLPATDVLAIFPHFHASVEHNFLDVMLPKQSCILFTMQAIMLLISLNKMPIFESICNNTFLDIFHQSSNGPMKYIVLSPYVKYDAKTLVLHVVVL